MDVCRIGVNEVALALRGESMWPFVCSSTAIGAIFINCMLLYWRGSCVSRAYPLRILCEVSEGVCEVIVERRVRVCICGFVKLSKEKVKSCECHSLPCEKSGMNSDAPPVPAAAAVCTCT